jgi:hypothetical protein
MTEKESKDLQKAIGVMIEYPDNYARVGRALGITRSEAIEFVKRHALVFDEVKEEYLDDLTSTYKNVIAGLAKAPAGFNAGAVLKILAIERPAVWDPKKKKSVDEEGGILGGEVDGEAAELLEGHFEEKPKTQLLEEEDEARREIINELTE